MTLIVPVGEGSLSCITDGDVDSGCLARSTDDITKEDFNDKCVTHNLDGKPPGNGIEESIVKPLKSLPSDSGLLLHDTQMKSESNGDNVNKSSEPCNLKKSELKISLNCDNNDVCKSPHSVFYECQITVDTVSKCSPSDDQSTKCFESSISQNNSALNTGESSVENVEDNILVNKDQQQQPLNRIPECEENSVRSDSQSSDCEESETQHSKIILNNETKSVNSQNLKDNNTNDSSSVSSSNNNCTKGQNKVSVPSVKCILNSIPSEEQKAKLRKLMQRRSISESSSNDIDFGYLKKTRDKLRHSFSAYENCDKLHKILDRTLLSGKETVYENERLNNDVNAVLSTENSLENINALCFTNNASLEQISRKSCIEITDTLVDNVKKSMIEEYKNLKKNSSLANQNANDNSLEIYKGSHPNNRTQSECEGYPRNEREAFENVDINRTEIKDQTLVMKNDCNTTPNLDIRTRTVSEAESSSFSSVCVESASEFQRSKSFPLGDSNFNGLRNDIKIENVHNVSSPPTRLEVWKNILAEKRNSIKNHIKGFSKFNDTPKSNNNNTVKPQECVSLNKDAVDLDHCDSVDNSSKGNSNRRENEITDVESQAHIITEIRTQNVEHNTANLKYNNSNNNNIEREKQSCNNFICINSLHIIPCVNESQNLKETKAKSKLEEACQGIAKALNTLPASKAIIKSLNSNELKPKIEIKSNADDKKSSEIHNSKILTEKGLINKNNDNVSSSKNRSILNSNIASIITTIPPPIYVELTSNEKSQQCPTPPVYHSDDEGVPKRKQPGTVSTSSEDDSDYCQTDECGDDCDYCSGDEAEDEEEDTCDVCRRNRSLSPVCKHTRVITNGSLRPLRKHILHEECLNHRISGSRSLVLQAAMRRRHINHQELSAIREYSITSDDQHDSDEEQSHDDSMCDISSSWRYGLCEDHLNSTESTIKSEKSVETVPSEATIKLAKLKSNSLPASPPRPQVQSELPRRPGSVILKHVSNLEDEGSGNTISGVRLPPLPPRNNRLRNPIMSVSYPGNSTMSRPAMGLQGLQQRPSSSKLSHASGIPTGPKTLAPRSPINPNPPFGFPNPPSPPTASPASPFQGRKNHLEAPPSSPRTNSRSGALVTRNFSISDDEGGQRLSRRQVTITRHENAYKEAADKGYLLPPSSPIDPYWLNWKLGVLQKTVEEVGARLGESEKAVGAWGSMPQDQNLADQYVHNIRKFRETLPDLQRGIDDVNDQAARFSAHNVPLTPANSAALHDLNNRWKNLETNVNDRWRQLAGRSREVTPLTPAQLASSVCPPWERATATNKVPYYINHAQETTHWDHPQMMDLLDSLSEFNHIKFSAYRTATKLRSLQKKLSLDKAKLQLVTDVFDEHGLRGQNDRLIDVNDMVVVLSTLYGRIASDNTDVNTTLTTDLCLNWLLNVYDSQRTGQMRVLSFRVGLISLCRGHLEEKYRYMFRLIADPNRLVDQRKLGLLLHDCVQVPRQLGEVAAFGGSNIEPSVRSCFTKAGKDRETIEAVHFLTWVQQEPQSLVWLAVLHRVAASESVQHQVKCNICKTYPIVGLRYRCLKCLSFDMCQRCFFEGRSNKSHKITHPMHEYCTATTAGDEMKDFTKALKNKFKSKRSLQKHTKKGYLPVQTVLEGDPLESPSPSPSHNVSSQDMHSRLELYASRLAEVELRTNSNSTPDSEDEHGLIAQYCQSLSSSDAPFPVPKSPLQIMASVDADQKDELEQMIRDLEEENRALQAEYERLKSEQPSGSVLDEGMGQRSEAEMLAEAKLLREHKGRLEARMSILEDHNRQLEAQLQRLRQLLVEQQSGMGSPNKSSTLQTKSVTASQLAMDSPAKINGHSSQGGSGSAYEGLDQMSEYVRPPPPPVGSIAHMGNLFSRAGDLEKAVGSLVASMNREKESDSHSDDQSDENDYDNTVSASLSKSD